MKKYCLYALVAMLILHAAPAIAQEEMKEGMPPNPSFTVIMTETVLPGMSMEYEEGTKKLMETLKSVNAPFPIWAWQESNGTYNYGVPVQSFAAIDEFSMVWGKAAAQLRESDWGKKRQAAITNTKYTIWMDALHLSYMPEDYDMADMNNMMYSHVWAFKVPHKHEMAFNQAMMKMSAWMKEIGHEYAYFVHRNIIGEDGPLYVVVANSKDPADDWKGTNSLMGEHGEAFLAHRDEIGKYVTHVSEMFGWMRPDLSLMPEM